MDSFSSIINLWPTAEAFAEDVGISGVLARQWRRRNKIPSEHWNRVVGAAACRGFDGVTLLALANLAAARNGAADTQAA